MSSKRELQEAGRRKVNLSCCTISKQTRSQYGDICIDVTVAIHMTPLAKHEMMAVFCLIYEACLQLEAFQKARAAKASRVIDSTAAVGPGVPAAPSVLSAVQPAPAGTGSKPQVPYILATGPVQFTSTHTAGLTTKHEYPQPRQQAPTFATARQAIPSSDQTLQPQGTSARVQSSASSSVQASAASPVHQSGSGSSSRTGLTQPSQGSDESHKSSSPAFRSSSRTAQAPQNVPTPSSGPKLPEACPCPQTHCTCCCHTPCSRVQPHCCASLY